MPRVKVVANNLPTSSRARGPGEIDVYGDYLAHEIQAWPSHGAARDGDGDETGEKHAYGRFERQRHAPAVKPVLPPHRAS